MSITGEESIEAQNSNIYDLMKEEGTRISQNYYNRWLVWDGEWVVYERKYMAKITKELYRGSDESKAVKIMLEERS